MILSEVGKSRLGSTVHRYCLSRILPERKDILLLAATVQAIIHILSVRNPWNSYLLKYVAYRFYQLGYFEARRRNIQNDRNNKKQLVTFDDTVSISEANIKNNRRDKKFITIGTNSVVLGELILFKHGGNISIGDNCFI